MTDLYELIRRRNWRGAMLHCQENPEEAKHGKYHWATPLIAALEWTHMLPEPTYELFLLALIEANPDALLSTSPRTGDLPLHMICQRSRGISLELFQEFLIRKPATVHQTNRISAGAQIPLFVLWQQRPFPRENETTFPRSTWSLEVHQIFASFYAKVDLLVEAMILLHHQQSSSTDDSNKHPQGSSNSSIHDPTLVVPYKIHAFISLIQMDGKAYSSEVLEYLCDKYPQQVHTRDESGQLPLHLILTTYGGPCQCQGRGMIQVVLAKYPHAARARLFSQWDCCYGWWKTSMRTSSGTVYGRYPLHIALVNRLSWQFGVRELVHIAPDIVSVPDPVNGRYPLHIALANGWCWEDVKELVQAAPEILSVPDPVTMLYPFQLSATYSSQGSRTLHSGREAMYPETIIQLLGPCPDLVMHKLC